jgi:hypothetical protein
MLSIAGVEASKRSFDVYLELWLEAYHVNEDEDAHSNVGFDESNDRSQHSTQGESSSSNTGRNKGSESRDINDHSAGRDESNWSRVRFIDTSWSGPEMFSIDFMAGMLVISLNLSHPVGNSMSAILNRDDEPAADLVRTLLYSWSRMEDELPDRQRQRVMHARYDWGRVALDIVGNVNE